jgi:hypothetical protein
MTGMTLPSSMKSNSSSQNLSDGAVMPRTPQLGRVKANSDKIGDLTKFIHALANLPITLSGNDLIVKLSLCYLI